MPAGEIRALVAGAEVLPVPIDPAGHEGVIGLRHFVSESGLPELGIRCPEGSLLVSPLDGEVQVIPHPRDLVLDFFFPAVFFGWDFGAWTAPTSQVPPGMKDVGVGDVLRDLRTWVPDKEEAVPIVGTGPWEAVLYLSRPSGDWFEGREIEIMTYEGHVVLVRANQ